MYKCLGCGAGLRFDPASQKMVCDHCNSNFDPRDKRLSYTLKAGEQETGEQGTASSNGKTFDTIVYTCPNCGGQLLSTEEAAATFCSYCGASVMLESRIEKLDAPEYIIPFKLTKEQCAEAYKKQLGKALFAPSSMKKSDQIEQFRGIYMPYWIYDYQYEDTISAKGRTEKRKGDYIYTDHYLVSRGVQAKYNGLSYDASSSFSDSLSQAAAPFKINECEDFAPSFMSGFYADVSDVGAHIYEKEGAEKVTSYIAGETTKNPAYSKYNVSGSDVQKEIFLGSPECHKGMFPVWFLASQSRDKKRVSYAVVNGQTGKVAADLPIDFGKYIIFSLLLSIPLFILFNIGFVMTPTRLLFISCLISLIGLLILNSQLNKTYTAEHYLDDAGLRSVHPELGRKSNEKKKSAETAEVQKDKAAQNASKAKKKKKGELTALQSLGIIVAVIVGIFLLMTLEFFGVGDVISLLAALMFPLGVLWVIIDHFVKKYKEKHKNVTVEKMPGESKWAVLSKPIAGILLGVIVFIVDPVQDMYFYGAAIVSMFLMLWSTFDIVQQHNRQTMRKLPQFNKRGGDR